MQVVKSPTATIGPRSSATCPTWIRRSAATSSPNKPGAGPQRFPPCVKKKLPWQGKIQVVKNGNITNKFIK